MGSIVALSFILLLPVSLTLNVIAIVRANRSGAGLSTLTLNIILAVTVSALILTLLGAFIVDQYPCWIGIPNCD